MTGASSNNTDSIHDIVFIVLLANPDCNDWATGKRNRQWLIAFIEKQVFAHDDDGLDERVKMFWSFSNAFAKMFGAVAVRQLQGSDRVESTERVVRQNFAAVIKAKSPSSKTPSPFGRGLG